LTNQGNDRIVSVSEEFTELHRWHLPRKIPDVLLELVIKIVE
jgi:hypothetical protein